MGLKLEEIKSLIKKSSRHLSKIFIGKSKIEQHKLVYKALNGKMGNELHALALNTIES